MNWVDIGLMAVCMFFGLLVVGLVLWAWFEISWRLHVRHLRRLREMMKESER